MLHSKEIVALLEDVRAALMESQKKMLDAGYYFKADELKEIAGRVDDMIDKLEQEGDQIPYDYLP